MKFMMPILTVLFVMGFAGTSFADPCDAAKREMAFGEAATEDARDKVGFKRAADEFNKAAQKAPNCAAVFFNLGVVQQKAGELAAAKAAYERYLKLVPNAPDADSVKQHIFKLEYRIGQAQAKEAENRNKSKQAHQIGGMWKTITEIKSFKS